MRVVNDIKFYDYNEVSDMLGISKNTITNLKKKGLLSSIRLGKSCFISEDSINGYLRGKGQNTKIESII